MPKNLDSDENINPILSRFTHFLEIFGQKKCFGVKNSVSWARSALLHGIYCICSEISKYAFENL